MRPIIRKRLKAAARRSERAAISQAVSPPPAPGSPLAQADELTKLFAVDRARPREQPLTEEALMAAASRPRQQDPVLVPPDVYRRLCPGCRSLDGEHDFGPTCTLSERCVFPDPGVPGIDGPPETGVLRRAVAAVGKTPPPAAPAPRRGPITAEDEPLAVEVGETLLAPPAACGLPPSEPAQGASDWEVVDTGSQSSPWVAERSLVPEVPAGSPGGGNLALPAAPLGPADVRSYFLAGRAPSTRAAYASDLQHFARWRGLEIDQALSDFLTGSAAQAHATALGWLQAMTEAKLAPATVARRLASLRSFVELAAQLGVVTWTLLLKAPKVEPFRDTRGPGREEVRKLMNHCGEGLEGVRNRALIVVFLGCGLRRNELALLRLRDYSRETGRIFVRGKGKGGEGKWLSLPAESSELLDRWLCESRQIACGEMGPLEREDDEPLFHSLERRERLSGEGIRYILNVVGKRAGVKIRPHGLRHAAITAVLEETGGNIRVAQSFSRHADPRTVLKYDDNRKDLGGEAAKIALRKILRGDEKEE